MDAFYVSNASESKSMMFSLTVVGFLILVAILDAILELTIKKVSRIDLNKIDKH